MYGNPIECRLYALRCSLLAKAAATLKLSRALLSLGRNVEKVRSRIGIRSGVSPNDL